MEVINEELNKEFWPEIISRAMRYDESACRLLITAINRKYKINDMETIIFYAIDGNEYACKLLKVAMKNGYKKPGLEELINTIEEHKDIWWLLRAIRKR